MDGINHQKGDGLKHYFKHGTSLSHTQCRPTWLHTYIGHETVWKRDGDYLEPPRTGQAPLDLPGGAVALPSLGGKPV